MKKITLLVGALGGTLAGYLFSNERLREQLAKAKDPQSAAKVLGEHLSKDGKKLAKDVQDFIKSDEVQKNMKKARTYAEQKITEAKDEITSRMSWGASQAKKTASRKVKSAAKKMRVKVREV